MKIKKETLKETRGRPLVYDYKNMKVGDYLFLEGYDSYSYANKWGKKFGRVYTGRRTDGGLYLWRIK